MGKSLEDKEIVTSGKITQALIGNWLLWYIVFGFLYIIILSLITSKMESMVLVEIISVIFQVIILFIVWKLSTFFSFKKKTIVYNDISKVMKNLIIFTIAMCIFECIYGVSTVNSSIEKALQSDYEIKMSFFHNDTEMKEYQKQKEEMIKEIKSKKYTYIIISEIGITAVYLAMLPLEKKEILKYVR